MDIPLSVEDWVSQLTSDSNGGRSIIENLKKERCIPVSVCEQFFAQLAAIGEPENCKKAREMAEKVVRDNAGQCLCQGKEIDSGIFQILFRCEDITSLRRRVPDCLDRLGITEDELNGNLPEEDLRSVTDEYSGEINLGNKLGICWVTDHGNIEGFADLENLIGCLGLDNFMDEEYCVLCIYERNTTQQTLHLPRIFDAIDAPAFVIQEDCDADFGKTRPLAPLPPEMGLPEAVHMGCSIVPNEWKLGTIK